MISKQTIEAILGELREIRMILAIPPARLLKVEKDLRKALEPREPSKVKKSVQLKVVKDDG